MTPPATKTAEGRTVSRMYRVEFTAKQLEQYEEALGRAIRAFDVLAMEQGGDDMAKEFERPMAVLEKLLEKLQIQSRRVPTSTPPKEPMR